MERVSIYAFLSQKRGFRRGVNPRAVHRCSADMCEHLWGRGLSGSGLPTDADKVGYRAHLARVRKAAAEKSGNERLHSGARGV